MATTEDDNYLSCGETEKTPLKIEEMVNSENEEEIDTEELTSESSLKKTFIGKVNNIRFHKTDIQFIFNMTENWEYNREKDEKHQKFLLENIINIYGSYKVARCLYDNNKLLLVDGQHRRDAMIEYQITHPGYNPTIMLEVFDVNTEDEIMDYFKAINGSLRINYSQVPRLAYKDLVKNLAEKYPSAIRNGDKTCRPYFTKPNLLRILQGSRVIETYKISGKTLLDMILAKNNEYMYKTFSQLGFKITHGSYDKAKNSGCYLGLDENFLWLDSIKAELASQMPNTKAIHKIKIQTKVKK